MRLSFLCSAIATLTAAASLPPSELRPLNPRSFASAKNLFNRQSTFLCSSGYTCYDYQTCCGIDCCNAGYACSSILTCDAVSTCTAYQTVCGTTCCDSGYYCGTDLNCYANTAAPASCTAYETVCGSTCCDSGYYCATDLNCYASAAPTVASSQPTSVPTSNTCSATEQTCGTTCCGLDQICDSSSSTCSSKPHKPKTSTSGDEASKKLPAKVIGGLVTGVIVGIGLIGAFVLFLWRRCFGKKKTVEGGGEEPPAYGVDGKVPEAQVSEVRAEMK